MRWLSQVLIPLIVCLVAIALPPTPTQAVCVPYSIELSPSSGPPGTKVTVYGHDFGEGKHVDIYYDGELFVEGIETGSSRDFTVIITIPEDCSGYYQVHADVGYAEADAYFTVKPGLTVSPQKGPVGTNVTIEGQGFARNEEGIELMYYLNDSYETIERRISANVKGSWERSFPIPPSNRGEHKIDAEGAESKPYEVKDAIFRVTAEITIDKPSGIVGDTIVVTGSRFEAYEKSIKILLDGQTVDVDKNIKVNGQGDWKASFEVPEMPAGEYIVTAEGEWTKKEDISEHSFEIKPDIVLSPNEGHVGTDLTVSGHGFAANEDVVIMYDGNQKTTATTNDQGSFSGVSFLVPESQYGERLMTAEDAAGNNATTIFTMESNHPATPALISPANKNRLGFIGKVAPTFEWSQVSDDSGVRYRLQIATSANFTATGEFVHPLVSVPDIVETSYTLNATEALPYGTYYWIVQAVDGAENESGWAAARSFRAGLLPLWAFILIIVAIVVLLAALIRALVIRRRYYY